MTEYDADAPVHLIVMGVAGSGKSTVAEAIQKALGWPFAEGDDFHPQSNVDKMSEGRPLTDGDRLPWLRALAEWTAERDAKGQSTIVTCSALKQAYRDELRKGGRTIFVHLHGSKDILLERITGREDHFMPPELLESQLDTLEPFAPHEDSLPCDIANTPEQIAQSVVDRLPAHVQV